MPPALLLATARATGKIDLAPFPSSAALARALERFDPPDPEGALRALFEAGVAAFGRRESPAANVAIRSNHPVDDAANIIWWPHQDASAFSGTVERHSSSTRWWLLTAAIPGLAGLVIGTAVALLLNFKDAMPHPTAATEITVTTSHGNPQDQQRAVTVTQRQIIAQPQFPRATGGQRQERPGTQMSSREPMPAGRKSPVAPPVQSAPTPLIDPAAADADAAFSPSFASKGSAVFFHAQRDESSALKRADRDENGELHIVTIVDDTAKNYHVQVSPDSRLVAFDSDRDGVRGVYVAEADGSEVRRVSGPGYAAVPRWSPDGHRLAFLRAENDKPRCGTSGRGLRHERDDAPHKPSLRTGLGRRWFPVWSPDRRQPRGSADLLDPDSGPVDELYVTAQGPAGSDTRRIPGWPVDHVSGVPGRCLAARPGQRIDGTRARRCDRGGVHVGARRAERCVSQPAKRRMGTVADGRALTP